MIKVGIVGGPGYIGVELLWLLAQHPEVEIAVITSRGEAGTSVADVFPSLCGRVDSCLVAPDAAGLELCYPPCDIAMQQAQALGASPEYKPYCGALAARELHAVDPLGHQQPRKRSRWLGGVEHEHHVWV